MTKLLIATNNPGKKKEYNKLLHGIDWELVSPQDIGIDPAVDEVETTFEGNAYLKATVCAARAGLVTLADDSGLEVESLGGEPGVFSARYAGPAANDQQRVDYLLSKMQGIPWEQRTARFKCVIAIAQSSGEVRLCDGTCHGIITYEPKGVQGFGYDPVFFLPHLGKTMAELTSDQK
ncbi:MAG: RdgB/HAM1 family non-canonical purine NTP pyrophosphatase, partial [Chloroflexota bacterium]|nr:RdgB/HAM1 family non-canonical purine NTP pyrophosphatase [Chloroflexota bacterium]